MHSSLRTIHHHAKQTYLKLAPSHVLASAARKRTIEQFAKKYHLVYFGYIGRATEDNRLVRGLTMSTTHADNHYCIGTVQGYDMVFLERTDSIKLSRKSKNVSHSWLVLQIDLQESLDLPHIFLGTRSHSDEFYSRLFTSFSHLKRAPLGMLGQHSSDFTHHYTIYTTPSHSITAEQLFTVDTTKIIGTHFRPLAIEVLGNSLYIYADNQRPTAGFLDTMINNGIWLADKLNHQGEQLIQ